QGRHIGERLRDVVDVLERAKVDHSVVRLVVRDWLVEVVNEGGALVARVVKRVHQVGAEVLHQGGFAVGPGLLLVPGANQLEQRVLGDVDSLPAYGRHPAEWLSGGRKFEEMQAVDVDAHSSLNAFVCFLRQAISGRGRAGVNRVPRRGAAGSRRMRAASRPWLKRRSSELRPGTQRSKRWV